MTHPATIAIGAYALLGTCVCGRNVRLDDDEDAIGRCESCDRTYRVAVAIQLTPTREEGATHDDG